jgi:hypothetical protein
MPRFEMHLMVAEKSDDKFETVEYDIVCFVKDPTDMKEVQSSANEIISDHLANAGNVVLFGTAVVEVSGEEIFNIAFQNKDADQEEVNSIMGLCVLGEETIH